MARIPSRQKKNPTLRGWKLRDGRAGIRWTRDTREGKRIFIRRRTKGWLALQGVQSEPTDLTIGEVDESIGPFRTAKLAKEGAATAWLDPLEILADEGRTNPSRQKKILAKWKLVKPFKGDSKTPASFRLYRAYVKGQEYELAIAGRLAILNRIDSRSGRSVSLKLIKRWTFEDWDTLPAIRKTAMEWADLELFDDLEILSKTFGRKNPPRAKKNMLYKTADHARDDSIPPKVAVACDTAQEMYVGTIWDKPEQVPVGRGSTFPIAIRTQAAEVLGIHVLRLGKSIRLVAELRWLHAPSGPGEAFYITISPDRVMEEWKKRSRRNPRRRGRRNPTYDEEKAMAKKILRTLTKKGPLPRHFAPKLKVHGHYVVGGFAQVINKPAAHAADILNRTLDLPEFDVEAPPERKKREKKPRPKPQTMKLLPEREDLENVLSFLEEVFASGINSQIYSPDEALDRLHELMDSAHDAAERGDQAGLQAGVAAINALYLPFDKGYLIREGNKVSLELPPEYVHPKDIGKVQALRKWTKDFSGERRFRVKALNTLGQLYGPVWKSLPEDIKDARIQEVLITWQSSLLGALGNDEAFDDFTANARVHAEHVSRTYMASDRESAGKFAAEDIEQLKERGKELAAARSERKRVGTAMTTVLRRLEAGSPAEQQWALLFRLHKGEVVRGFPKQPVRTLGRKKKGGSREPKTSKAHQDLTGEKYVLRRGQESMKGSVILVSSSEPKYHGAGALSTPCPTCIQLGRFFRVPRTNVRQGIDAVLVEMAVLHAG